MSLGFLNRSPDARLQRAEWIAGEWGRGVRPSLEYEDPAVVSYAEFLHALSSLPFPGKERYKVMHPVLAEVHYLIGASINIPRQFASTQAAAASKDRAVVKALVLCNSKPEDIAAYLGFKTQSIIDFEYLVFDVRSRLNERGYIHNYVLSGTVLDRASTGDFEQQLIRQAYMYGLEGVKPYLGLAVEEEDLESMHNQLRRELSLKALTATRAMSINNHTADQILTHNAAYQKMKDDREFRDKTINVGGSGVSTPREVQERIIGLIGGIGLSVAPTALESDVESGAKVERRVTKVFEAEVLSVLQEEAEKSSKGAADG